MKETLDELKRIEKEALAIGDAIRREGQIARAELEERLKLGLHGEEAIAHYNNWMKSYNLEHLMV